MTFAHPITFGVALLLTGAMVFIFRWRRIRSRLLPIAALLLAIAVGNPTIHLHPVQAITVMVDVSPSTRGALYRSRSSLRHRVSELVGSTLIRWIQFSDHNEPLEVNNADDAIREMPCEATTFSPKPNNPVLLFSDGVFDTSAPLPRIYPVVDPLLSDTHDAAVRNLTINGDQASTTISNDASGTILRWTGTKSTDQPITRGSTIFDAEITGNEITARVLAHDRWPENDSLSAVASPPRALDRWWVGEGPPAGWKPVRPAALPNELQPYLSALLIALNNVPANEIGAVQQSNLRDYVQHLGGGLLIAGGDHAFGSGGYSGTELQKLSPLSGYPPAPVTQWTILLDRSGSMAGEVQGATRLQNATAAVTQLIPHLPPNDRVSVGEFAEALDWVVQNATTSDAATALRQCNGNASGPTNLEAALRSLPATPRTLPNHVLVLTDGETPIDNDSDLIAQLNSSRIQVDVLLLASATASPELIKIVNSTGGRMTSVDDTADLSSNLQVLAQSNPGNSFIPQKATVHFRPDAHLSDRDVSGFNPTWIVDHAIALTDGEGPRAARWLFGAGAVGAVAFTPNATELTDFEKMLATPPTDPDLRIDWLGGRGVRINAKNRDGFKNDLELSLSIGDAASLPVPLVSPGRYEAWIRAPRRLTTALIRNGQRIIDRRIIPGRYPPEFDRIGNDIAALQQIADHTGGALIAPNLHTPIDFHWPEKTSSLSEWFAVAAAVVIGYACILRRI